MLLITPITITDARLASSTVAETDYAAWAAGTAYALGARVIRTSTHRIYQRLIAGTTATAPELDPINWQDIGPTSRWAMFDRSVGTRTAAASSLTVRLAPASNCDSLALLDLDCESVSISITSAGAVVYTREFPALMLNNSRNWYEWFFAPFVGRRTIVLTDLPPYSDAQITITLRKSSGVSVGSCLLGSAYSLGDTKFGATVGIIDYSVKTTDAFGATDITERAYAKRLNCQLIVPAADVDEVARRLAAVRATPVVWIGGEDYDSSVIYGWVRDWSIDIALPTRSYCSLTVEGLT